MSAFFRLPASAITGALSCVGAFVAVVFLSAAFTETVLAATRDQPLDLIEAVRLAEQAAPMISARHAASDAAERLIGPAGERPDPELIIGVDNLPITTRDAFTIDRDFMTMRKIGVMQAFPRREKRRLRQQRAAADLAQAQALLTAEQLATREAVAIAWITLAYAEQRRQLTTALRVNADALIAAANAAIGSGRGSTSDAIAARQARIALDDRIDAQNLARDQAQAALAQWLPLDAKRPLAKAPDWTDLGMDLGTDADRWRIGISHHRELLALDAIASAAETDIALAEAEKRPDWSLELAYAQRGPDYSNMVSLQFRIGLPLFSERRQQPVVAAREATLRQIQAERSATERMHSAAIAQIFSSWKISAQRARRYEHELLELGDQRAETALAAYRGGTGNLAAVLAARDAATEQRLAYLDVLQALGQAWATLNFSFAEERAP